MSRYDIVPILKTLGSGLRVSNASATCAECRPLCQRRVAMPLHRSRSHLFSSRAVSVRVLSTSAPRAEPSSTVKRSVTTLGEKAEMEIGMRGRLASVVPPRRCKEVTHRVGSKFGGAHSLRWTTPPKTILLAKKANDPKTTAAAKRIVRHLLTEYQGLSIVVEKEVYDDLRSALDLDDQSMLKQLVVLKAADRDNLVSKVDLVVTLGGDGTVLHVASLFANGAVPPILGVSMGTLGFLMPFNLKQFKGAFRQVMQSEASLLLRMRLQCAIHDASGGLVTRNGDAGSQALNEVHLHRGRHPHLTIIETFVDGQHLTEAISDGLIVSTPTGSTAYSLSAGGPIVHPSVPSLLLTPICPRSLSFRSVLLPSDVCIQMRISPKSRAPAELSLDGRSVQFLEPGEYLSVSMSRYPVPCIVPTSKIITPGIPQSVLCKPQQSQGSAAGEEDEVLDGGWVQDINGMLSFNKAFVTKGMMKHIGDD